MHSVPTSVRGTRLGCTHPMSPSNTGHSRQEVAHSKRLNGGPSWWCPRPVGSPEASAPPATDTAEAQAGTFRLTAILCGASARGGPPPSSPARFALAGPPDADHRSPRSIVICLSRLFLGSTWPGLCRNLSLRCVLTLARRKVRRMHFPEVMGSSHLARTLNRCGLRGPRKPFSKT